MNKEFEDKQVWIGLSTTKTLLAFLIGLFTKRSGPTHAWISWWDPVIQQRLLLESQFKGLSVISWKRWRKRDPGTKIWVFTSPKIDLQPGLIKVAEKLNTPYDFRGMLWHALKKLFKAWFKKPWESPNRFTCSESIVRFLQYNNVPNATLLNPEGTTPADLLEFCVENKWLTPIYDNKKL